MNTQFDILKATRENYIKAIDSVSLEEINAIPQGFNNNIIWNAAHVLVTQQLLCYGLSNNKLRIPEQYVPLYRKGSKPEKKVEQQEINLIRTWLIDSIDWLIEDYQKGLFKEYQAYPTSFGFVLDSIERAISFNNVHEGMHLGWIGAIKKKVGTSTIVS